MLRRVVLASLLLVAGAPMIGRAETTFLGVLLIVVGLAVLVVPSYLRRTEAE